MWICKYCETKNNSGDHCFLCGFFNDPELKTVEPAELKVENEERDSKIIAKEEKTTIHPEVKDPDILVYTEKEAVVRPETASGPDVYPGGADHSGEYGDDIPWFEEELAQEKRLGLTVKQNKKKRNRVMAILAAVNILLAAANGLICYFVFG